MHSIRSTAATAISEAVAIDLIGDLDTTLASALDDALEGVARDGAGAAVVVSTRYVIRSTPGGLTRFDVALLKARTRGCAIRVDAGCRRMRTAFALAKIACDDDARSANGRRHVMIAHHATDRIGA
ncbi:MAG: hypothetical protein NVS2B3_12280 [Vulcanimicrobiaceae bacterium]